MYEFSLVNSRWSFGLFVQLSFAVAVSCSGVIEPSTFATLVRVWSSVGEFGAVFGASALRSEAMPPSFFFSLARI
jgi:hypothetical protein